MKKAAIILVFLALCCAVSASQTTVSPGDELQILEQLQDRAVSLVIQFTGNNAAYVTAFIIFGLLASAVGMILLFLFGVYVIFFSKK